MLHSYTLTFVPVPGIAVLMTAIQPPGWVAAISLSLLFVILLYIFQSFQEPVNAKDLTDPSQIYSNLELRVDASQDEIRLLYLHPGKWDDELICTLKAVELGNNPHYVALSYAWLENHPAKDKGKNSTSGYVNIYSWWTLFMPKGTRTRLIKVNNGALGIGTNLELALRHMRSAPGGPTIAVFADAICINQRDLQDRSSQVTLLREIYRKAARVEIWLGAEREFDQTGSAQASPMASSSSLSLRSTFTAQTTIRSVGRSECGSDSGSSTDSAQRPSSFELEFSTYQTDSARVSACLDDWYQYYSRPKLFRTDPPPNYTLGFFCMIWLLAHDAFKSCERSRRTKLTKRVPFLAEPTRRATLDVFSELMNRVWWNRLWVLQEMTIASDLVVRYGRFVIPWEVLARASKNILHHMHQSCCSDDFEKLGRNEAELLHSYAHKIVVLDRWRARWNQDAESSSPRISLLRLMRKFRDRETSNPRDKVYALLPLVNYWGRPKVNGQMVANYDLSVADVYKKVTKTLLSMEESLDVLVGSRRKSRRASLILPSWVPDWSTTGPVDAMVERTELYRASRDIPLQFRTFDKNRYLELHGIKHDFVVLVGDIMLSESHLHGHISSSAQATFQNWKRLARLDEEGGQNYHKCIHSTATGRPESKMLAFVRTMCMDSIYVDREDDGYNLESSSQCYERVSPAFRDSVDGWSDPLRENSVTDDDSDGGLIRALPLTQNLLPPGTEDAEELLRPLEQSHVPGQREAHSVDKAVETATANRRFFVTSKGYMGLGPADTQTGDYVFVLFGGSVPFLLRDAGHRHVPGLNLREEDFKLSKHEQGFEKRGRQVSPSLKASTENGSAESPTPLLEKINEDSIIPLIENEPVKQEGLAEAGWSGSTSADQSRSSTSAGTYAKEIGCYKSGLTLHSHRVQPNVYSRTLNQCYELVGDCFVHGIMDGEGTTCMRDGNEEAVEPDLVYLV